jgi:hypothetical protein
MASMVTRRLWSCNMPAMDMYADMSTNGLGDAQLEGLYRITDGTQASA